MISPTFHFLMLGLGLGLGFGLGCYDEDDDEWCEDYPAPDPECHQQAMMEFLLDTN